MTDWHSITAAITAATGQPCHPQSCQELGGGCINRAFVLRDGAQAWFVKLNSARRLAMFTAEAAGLEALAMAEALRVPRPLCAGTAGDEAFLVLEFIAFGRAGPRSPATAGHQLAALHRQTQERFGWQHDNFIGATPQANAVDSDWARFWQERRLRPNSTWPGHGAMGVVSRSVASGCWRPARPCSTMPHRQPCSTVASGVATWPMTRTGRR